MHDIPDLPWDKVGTDIFTLKGRNYLITTDYYNNFFEVDFLPENTSEAVIQKLKPHFARHGIPSTVISDGGPQYTGNKFHNFSKKYGFKHETSSPGNSKANGAAEAAVKIAKRMMKKCNAANEDPYLGLLNIRNTPTEGLQTSPAQRLMGRSTRTQVPSTLEPLRPSKFNHEKEDLEDRRMCILDRHDTSNPGQTLKPLSTGDTVRMQPIQSGKTEWSEATVTGKLKSRTYTVQTNDGYKYRSNRQQLRLMKKSRRPEPTNIEISVSDPPQPAVATQQNNVPRTPSTTSTPETLPKQQLPDADHPPAYHTRSGRAVKSIRRLDL
ncbi:uncharacterized protein K02A2.6-like [Haliotis rubra]|uniref:uncharacterized protein K02A2.6-like n=1 Tax=Haliotis rubra TaxID=36100 RepID=UPI001EE55F93|nr:uncharacterized protein K02A2.6-like [Haliotis rubra]